MSLRRLMPFGFLALAVSALFGAVTSAAPTPPPAPAGFELGGEPERGKAVFAKHCALCHGDAGDAKGKMADTLKPRPADFTDKALMGKRSDWELYLAARDGGPAIGLAKTMFGWKGLLPDQEIRDAVAFVRSLSR
jgi:mono/diheme cytochrome c family protein